MPRAQPARSHQRYLSAHLETSRPPVPQRDIKIPNVDTESLSVRIGKRSQTDLIEAIRPVSEALQGDVTVLSAEDRLRFVEAKNKLAAGDLGGMVIGGLS